MNSIIDEIKSFVAQNRTSDALSSLYELSQNNKQIHDAVHIVLAEFNELTSQRLKGTIDNSEATRRLNIIHDKILIALGAFNSQGKVLPGSVAVKKNSAASFLGKLTLGFASLSILAYIAEYFWMKFTNADFWAWFGVPLVLGSFTFIAYLLSMVVSAFKEK